MGYKFQFVTLAGFHAVNMSMFELAHAYRDEGMLAYSRFQECEFQFDGTTATARSNIRRSSAAGTLMRSRRSSPRVKAPWPP